VVAENLNCRFSHGPWPPSVEGRVFRKGDRRILLLWLLTVAVRLVFGGVGAVAFHKAFNADELWLGMGVTLAAQHVVMTRRKADAPLRGTGSDTVPTAGRRAGAGRGEGPWPDRPGPATERRRVVRCARLCGGGRCEISLRCGVV
jgi:hypothetical protein